MKLTKSEKAKNIMIRKIFGHCPKRAKGKIIPWRLSIADNAVEYEYELHVRDTHCISSVWEVIRKAFRAKQCVGKIRK